jgi:hypothetical protein
VSVIGVIYPAPLAKKILEDEGKKFGIDIEVAFS